MYLYRNRPYYFICFENVKIYQNKCLICSYIQTFTLEFIATLKITIYSTKHTQNTKLHLRKYIFIFPKIKHLNSYCYVYFHGTINIWFISTIFIFGGHSPASYMYYFCSFNIHIFIYTYNWLEWLQVLNSLNICWGPPFLLAVTALVVIVGFPLFGPPRENDYCS